MGEKEVVDRFQPMELLRIFNEFVEGLEEARKNPPPRRTIEEWDLIIEGVRIGMAYARITIRELAEIRYKTKEEH